MLLCSVGEQAGVLPWLDLGYFHTEKNPLEDPKGLTRLKISKIMKTEILFQAAVLITFFKLGKKYHQLLHLVLQQKRYLSVNEISLGPLYSLCATKFI